MISDENVRTPHSRLTTKLIRSGILDTSAAVVLDALLARDVRLIEGGMPVFEQGDKPESIEIILDGWAVRERVMTDGRRQTVGILCNGDVCDFNIFMMARVDSGCRAVGPVRVARIGRQALNILNRQHPRVGQALWWETMSSASIQREWVANLAARRAEPRIAGLFCMLLARATLAGSVKDAAMAWPFTQVDLASACGLTAEHCNRTLRSLRERDLMVLEDGTIAFPDPAALAELAGFDASALHCDPALLPFANGRAADICESITSSLGQVFA
jgi:CRP-like cAMP-binding protein